MSRPTMISNLVLDQVSSVGSDGTITTFYWMAVTDGWRREARPLDGVVWDGEGRVILDGTEPTD